MGSRANSASRPGKVLWPHAYLSRGMSSLRSSLRHAKSDFTPQANTEKKNTRRKRSQVEDAGGNDEWNEHIEPLPSQASQTVGGEAPRRGLQKKKTVRREGLSIPAKQARSAGFKRTVMGKDLN
jgi:hypothetical protein